MISVLVLTHGDLAQELLEAACTIDPFLREASAALALPWDVDSDEATSLLKEELRELDHGEGTLILTDMFGGTATNLALPYMDCGLAALRSLRIPAGGARGSLRRGGA